eukprot:gnl/Chilomastix_cuspidata/5843.p2 GENE.gnl/Chilomastix_cuspidata/5843~~gnl/Chilomastix_cuspidata/5843.p2  ORF type:complete len:108 (-),score=4.85 gnl/Chilomastix_cuspidata/5843:374-697(-)
MGFAYSTTIRTVTQTSLCLALAQHKNAPQCSCMNDWKNKCAGLCSFSLAPPTEKQASSSNTTARARSVGVAADGSALKNVYITFAMRRVTLPDATANPGEKLQSITA